jgi:transcriptional regulator
MRTLGLGGTIALAGWKEPGTDVPAPIQRHGRRRGATACCRSGVGGAGHGRDDGFPLGTRLPALWSEDRLIFHMALANPHWRTIKGDAPALAVVTGTEAYISPSWYATKADHGRVVPTWNYSASHFTGLARVRREPDWLEYAVTSLTDHHEGRREEPRSVTDAPESFVAQQLMVVVGIELSITAVEAKAKRSQNRSTEDRSGVIAGLLAEPGAAGHMLASQMQADLDR